MTRGGRPPFSTTLAAALTVAVLAGCASGPRGRDGPPLRPPTDLATRPDAEPRVEPIRGSGGTSKPYRVLGRGYTPMTEDLPLRERGLASWYGRGFDGQSTASGESYDMYAMTAAHKTMPLPSYARVRNLDNGREVIVRVNDRGPFHDDRVIDLSYAAAAKLDLLRGVGPVEVERLTNEDIRTGAWRRGGGPGDAASLYARAGSAGQVGQVGQVGQAQPGSGGAELSAAPAPLSVVPSAVTAADTTRLAGPSVPVPAAFTSAVAAQNGTDDSQTNVRPRLEVRELAALPPAAQPTPRGPANNNDAPRPAPAAAAPGTPAPAAIDSGVGIGAGPAQGAIAGGGARNSGSGGSSSSSSSADRIASTSGYWVQLGAFSRADGAQRLREQVAQGLPEFASSVAVVSSGEGTHRVQTGPFDSRGAARDAAARMLDVLGLKSVLVER